MAVTLAGVLGLAAGCTSAGGDDPVWQGGGSGGGATTPPPDPGPQLGATVTDPPANATGVPALAQIAFTTTEATDAAVEVKTADGAAVAGKLTSDGKRWVPSAALKWGTAYTTTITVTGADGKTATSTSTFTTMAKPEKLVRVTSQLGDGAVVGVAMPLIIKFGRSIPKSFRDDVQRRMTVQSTPAQQGAWHWFSGSEVHYRPKTYWRSGTKLFYKVSARGVPMGAGWYGRSDITVDARVGAAVIMTVDNKTKRMTVTKDGKVLRRIPISLGKKSTPSSSGTMVVMEKLRKTIFDTFAELGPEEGYRTPIDYAQRITWGGEFIHAAPWSVASQGRRNVSHGCVNMSTANASWLFGVSKVGDPVVIKGTERRLRTGNGWTAWNMSWSDYVAGSALPVAG
ncbi:MAG TPA: Ig-like domain-containing protein [Pilimelia sp.]|nr:Ig-like domain-containing protein [Pilimelia sp.]